jgi:retron-type reverse transcriptase
MGWFRRLLDWLFGTSVGSSASGSGGSGSTRPSQHSGAWPRRRRPKLLPGRSKSQRQRLRGVSVPVRPYRYACVNQFDGGFRDLSGGGRPERLARFGLPELTTPEDIAAWLQITPGRLAWLTHRFNDSRKPTGPTDTHYVLRWIPKRSGGRRLIERPKKSLRAIQTTILREILSKASAHPAAHGFVRGRSAVTNATAHVGRRVVVRFDLANFYPSVRFNRVVAIFRGLGYGREAALWLARLTTSELPASLLAEQGFTAEIKPYIGRHLPQGASTSPALANLSAFVLDLRLAGLARRFKATYTRYADDITFSGDDRFLKSLRVFLPLVKEIIREERFRTNKSKCRILRNGNRQVVTGIVVNAKTNLRRSEFDALKAILTNCRRHGPSSQNRSGHPNFAAHLHGRISYVQQLNPQRAARLWAIYSRIDWDR